MGGRFDYDRHECHKDYDAARALPEETLDMWLRELARRLDGRRVSTVLDLGCGTGRFTLGLQRRFGASVYGVDPSEKMLAVAREGAAPGITFIKARGEDIPLPAGAVDLVFASMVYHHFESPHRVLREIRRVLRDGGFLAIRNATRENIAGVELFQFFPRARRLEIRRLPSRRHLRRTLRRAGFRELDFCTLRQKFAADYQEYYQKVSRRALSGLRLISDQEFDQGLAALHEHCQQRLGLGPVFESFDLCVGQAGPRRVGTSTRAPEPARGERP